MAIYITQRAFDTAAQLHQQGQVLDAWKTLARYGDHYAALAAHVLEGKWSLMNCVRLAHWQLTAPDHPAGGSMWEVIAYKAQEHYFRALSEYRNHRGDYCLPDSRQIEQTYLNAVTELELPARCVIHLCANRLTTPINRRAEALARFIFSILPLPFRKTLPNPNMLTDWFEVATDKATRLGRRGIDNSPQQSPDSYLKNLWLLARSISKGGLIYMAGNVGLRPRIVYPKLADTITSCVS
jgi:hypothetical protein